MQARIERIVRTLRAAPCVRGLVLGGSRATQTQDAQSDLDIGLYCEPGQLDPAQLSELAAQLDDGHRTQLFCAEGGWGPWVNCGAWLQVDGLAVDLIARDLARVREAVRNAEDGRFQPHYQTGHPHAFLDIAYRGELAESRLLWAADEGFVRLKRAAEPYPPALGRALQDFFAFEAGFSCSLAEKALAGGDRAYLCGLAWRAAAAMNQALFARNGRWCLNEKKAARRAAAFPVSPPDYAARLDAVFAALGADPAGALQQLRRLCRETTALCGA